jgi:hypothetical protein
LEEDLERLKGRLVDDGEDVAAARALFGPRSFARRRVSVERSSSSLGGRRTDRPRSVIVKNISSLRRRADVVRLIRYIGRLDGEAEQHVVGAGGKRNRAARPDQAVTLFDGLGNALDRKHVVSMVVDGWRLDDHENTTEGARILDMLQAGGRLLETRDRPGRSPVIRLFPASNDGRRGRRIDRRLVARLERVGAIERQGDDGALRWQRLADLPTDERFLDVRVRHVMMTIPLADCARKRLVSEAVGATVRDTFERWGFPTVRATHRDHGRHVHVHIALRVDNDAGERLPWDAQVCDYLRMVLADNARALGIRAEWRRRADRPEVVSAIECGESSLDESRSRADYRDGLAELPKLFRPLERLTRRVPYWFLNHGHEYVEREMPHRLARQLSKLTGRTLTSVDGGNQPVDETRAETRLNWLERLFSQKATPCPASEPLAVDLRPLAERLRHLKVYIGDTDGAVHSFAEMRQEAPGLAGWYLCHRPEIFGALEAGGDRRAKRDCVLREAVDALAAPVRPKDRSPNVLPYDVIHEVAVRYASYGLARDMRRLAASQRQLARELDVAFPDADMSTHRVIDAAILALEGRAEQLGGWLIDQRSRDRVVQAVAGRLQPPKKVASHQAPPTQQFYPETRAVLVGRRSRSSGNER